MIEEIWKDVVGYEGYYQVSNLGNVKSLTRKLKLPCGQIRTYKGRKIKPDTDSNGYQIIGLSKNGIVKEGKVHQLVLKAFVSPCPEGQVCRHFPDRNPANNKLENLQWGTKQQNNGTDRVVHGNSNDGYRCGGAKLTLIQVKEIRQSKNKTQTALAKQFGVTQSTIFDIIHRKSWKLWG